MRNILKTYIAATVNSATDSNPTMTESITTVLLLSAVTSGIEANIFSYVWLVKTESVSEVMTVSVKYFSVDERAMCETRSSL